MSNPVERFILNLSAAFSKRLDSAAFDIYLQKLSAWHLTEQQWAGACSQIIGNEDSFPKISQINSYLRAVMSDKHQLAVGECYWQMFSMGNYRQARKVDPMRQPAIPEGATDLHFCPPPRQEAGEDTRYPVEQLVESVTDSVELPF